MPLLIFLTCIFSLVISANGHALSMPEQDSLKPQRELFTAASKDIKARRYRQARQKFNQLAHYPLLPYLEYQLLLSRLSRRSVADIDKFLAKYSALPLANRLRLKALTAKAKYRHWDDVLALYRDGDPVTYQCINLRAVYHRIDKKTALAQVAPLWLTGTSLPKSCDPLLATWKKAGYQSEKLLWQRIELALSSRQQSLAKYLARSFSSKSAQKFNYWYRLYSTPGNLIKSHYWAQKGDFATSMLRIATERLIYQAPETALAMWPQVKDSRRFTAKTVDSLTNKLALKLISNEHPDQARWLDKLNWQTLNKSQRGQILRALVAQSRWRNITLSYQNHRQYQQPGLAWQYWYATALEHLGKGDDASAIYQQLASQRRYYGFLASDKLKRPYQLNHRSLGVAPALIKTVAAIPAVRRAQELLRLNRLIEARREWYHLLKSLNELQRMAAAHIADSWQWHNRAIITLTMTTARDDLAIRFPMPHLADYRHEARINKMTPSWPLAISRQESAFMTSAHSQAGAMGLMQLLPGTARQQARISKVRYRKRSQLLIPEFNIKLGTAYLARMLDKFDHNIAVAAAAYNAGPYRVKRWIKKELPQDQWIETIPYRETREYVKNILAYAVIYQHHLQRQTNMPSAEIKPTRMKIVNAQ